MFEWFSKQRRLKIMEEPFPSEWEDIIRRNMVHYSMLDDDEQKRLRGLIQIFMTEKSWEGCGGLELTDEIRVTISAQACLLILNLPHNYFENVETILIYPSEMMLPQRKPGFFETVLEPLEPARPISGQAFRQGPVILAWDTHCIRAVRSAPAATWCITSLPISWTCRTARRTARPGCATAKNTGIGSKPARANI